MKRVFMSAALAAALFGAAPLALAEPPPPKPAPGAERGVKGPPNPRPEAPRSGSNPAGLRPEAANPDPLRPVLGEAAPARPPRVHASHRVDVIAPGEKVETIFDRMRVQRPTKADEDVRPPLPARPMERHESQGPGQEHGSGRVSPAILPSSGGGFPSSVQPGGPCNNPARAPERDHGHR